MGEEEHTVKLDLCEKEQMQLELDLFTSRLVAYIAAPGIIGQPTGREGYEAADLRLGQRRQLRQDL